MRYLRRFFFIPIILIIFLVLIFAIYQEVRNKTIAQFNSEQIMIAKAASRGILDYMDEFKSELTFLSRFPGIIDFDEQGKELIKKYYENNADQIEAITRTDPNGIILATYPENLNVIGQNISSQNHVSKIIKSHKPIISDVFKSVQGYLAIAIHVPVFKNDEYQGSLAILIAIDKIGKRYLEDIRRGEFGYALLLSEDNIEIYCPFPDHIGNSILDVSGNDPSVDHLLTVIKNGNNGYSNCFHDDPKSDDYIEKYVSFYRIPLENTYWTILISVPKTEVYKTIAGFQHRLILLFSVLMIILFVYFYFFTKARTILREESKRKTAENALIASEEYNRTLFNQSPIGLALTTMDGQFVDINEAFAKIIGYTFEEALLLTYWDITPNTYEKQEKLQLESLKKTGVYGPYEKEYIHKDGHFIPVRLQGLIIERKGMPHIWSSVEDITEGKKAAEDLNYHQELLKEMGRVAKIGGWEFNTVTGKGTWTDEVALIHDLDPNDPTSVELGLSFYQEESKLKIENAVKEAIESGKPYDLEIELVSAIGIHKWIQTIGKPLIKNGKVINIRGSFQDITERKKIEEEIKTLNEELEQKVIERTKDLELKISEIERMNKLFIDRELRMIELKETIKTLKAKDKRN